MEGFEKFDLEDPGDIKYLIPSGFLKKLNSAEDLENLDEFDLMVRVVGAEASNQGREGQKAVAHVILNRLENPRSFGSDIKRVILKRKQFSPIIIASVPDDKLNEKQRKIKRKVLDPRSGYEPWELERVLESAGVVYFGGDKDNTGGADHFHHKDVLPSWAPSTEITARIRDHVFRRSR